jgi:hypothetical protein
VGDKPGGVGRGGGGKARHKYKDGMEHKDKSQHEDETCDTIWRWGMRRSTKARCETRTGCEMRTRHKTMTRHGTEAGHEARYEDNTQDAI